MAFVDEIILTFCSGKGGDGVIRWRSSPEKPKGGPAGGDGGRGGDIYIRAVRRVELLTKYASDPLFKAEDGKPGGKNSLEGKSGEPLIVNIPLGSIVTNLVTKESYDLLDEGKEILVLKGGAGGLGNERFKSSTNVSPYESTPGKKGVCAQFKVELRLIADAGFIGFPNAGKSTLLNELTNSKSKVGDYAFTTLDPHLGALDGFILADIPGLIEGASEGKGLGDKFLRHIMRTNMLIHCISAEREDIQEAYDTIRKELSAYNPALLEKQELVVLTKTDTLSEIELAKRVNEVQKITPNALTVSILDPERMKYLRQVILTTLHSQ